MDPNDSVWKTTSRTSADPQRAQVSRVVQVPYIGINIHSSSSGHEKIGLWGLLLLPRGIILSVMNGASDIRAGEGQEMPGVPSAGCSPVA